MLSFIGPIRRFSTIGLLWTALALSCVTAIALPVFAETGVRALDEPAIAVKAPDRVFLDAITRAGNRLIAAGEHGVIIYSDDNGLSWTQAIVPVNVLITAVSFATPTQGWAVGHYGVILHTQDAGATWQIQLNGLQADQLTLAAAEAAVAAKDPSLGTPLAIIRANHFIHGGADKPFLTIWVQSPQVAIVFGAYRLAMKTTDGGKTWADWSLHIGDPLSHNLYDAVPVGTQVVITAETGLIFLSTDGGKSFPAITPPGDATLFGAIATGDGGVLVFGVAGQAFLSQDGGRTWQTINLNTSDNLSAGCMLANGTILVAGEKGILYASRDRAHNFTPLHLTIPMAIFGLVQAPDGGLILAGSSGVMRVNSSSLKQS